MMASHIVSMGEEIFDRMERAVERVKDRLRRTTKALSDAGIPYAIVGGNAVAAWVSTVDPDAARNTRDVDVLVKRDDYKAICTAMEAEGFVAENILDVFMFLDGKDGKPSAGIHLIFEGEKVKPTYAVPAPKIEPVDVSGTSNVLILESLLSMKLQSYRLKDRTHIMDLMGVGLVDESMLDKVPPELRERLQALLDDPDG